MAPNVSPWYPSVKQTMRSLPGRSRLRQYCERDLERDLDGDRARVGEKHPVQVAGSHRRQPRGQLEGLLVYKAAEHHMRHRRQLAGHAVDDVRVIVSMADAPPRRDAIDELAAVGQHDPAAARPHDRQGRGAICIWQ